MIIWVLLIVVVMPLAYVRLAPSAPARFHRQAKPVETATQVRKTGYVWRQVLTDDGREMLQGLAVQAAETPRTTLLAGSVKEGRITYITRSAVFGFPDYTTMGLYDAPTGERFIEIYGRLRFGGSDFGVNAKRIKGWLTTLK